jgi:hypothetical protein
VAACSATVAIAAHSAAGGQLPTGAGLMLVLAASATVGAVSAATNSATGWARNLHLLGFLALGQLLGHVVLSVGGAHAHAAAPAIPMLAAHILAALLCAVLILLSEHLCRVLGSVLRAAVWPAWPAVGHGGRRSPAYRFVLTAQVLASGTGNRGPPALPSAT